MIPLVMVNMTRVSVVVREEMVIEEAEAAEQEMVEEMP